MDKKETGEYEEEKGTGSEAKKMGNERMGENEEVCPFENILFCPGTRILIPSGLKSPDFRPLLGCFPSVRRRKTVWI